MKKILKLLAVCMAMVLVFGMTVTVYAVESPDTSTAETSVANISAKTASGVEVKVTAVTQEVLTSALKVTASLGLTNASVQRVFDLTADISGKTNITISVPGITAGQKVAVLHQKANGKWERVPVVNVSAGQVTATFTSLSPVAIVTYTSEAPKDTTSTTDSTTSPKTGEGFPAAGAMCLATLFLAAVCFKKYAK